SDRSWSSRYEQILQVADDFILVGERSSATCLVYETCCFRILADSESEDRTTTPQILEQLSCQHAITPTISPVQKQKYVRRALHIDTVLIGHKPAQCNAVFYPVLLDEWAEQEPVKSIKVHGQAVCKVAAQPTQRR